MIPVLESSAQKLAKTACTLQAKFLVSHKFLNHKPGYCPLKKLTGNVHVLYVQKIHLNWQIDPLCASIDTRFACTVTHRLKFHGTTTI